MERIIRRIETARPESLANMLRSPTLSRRNANRIRDDAIPLTERSRAHLAKLAWDIPNPPKGYTFITDSGINVDVLFSEESEITILAYHIRLQNEPLRFIARDLECDTWHDITDRLTAPDTYNDNADPS